MFLMAMMALVMCGLAACSSSDDENGGQQAAKTDPALIGNWIEWVNGSSTEINQAMAFRNGNVLMYLQPMNSTVSGGWYHAEYTITGDGKMSMDVTPINMESFKTFDDCEWWAADSYHAYWDLSYSVKNDVLRIVFADSGKELVLHREAMK